MTIISHTQQVVEADGTVASVTGYCVSTWRTVLVYIFYILTGGILRLVFHWLPHVGLICKYRKCSLREATKVCIKDFYGGRHIHDIVMETPDGHRVSFFKRCLCIKLGSVVRTQVIGLGMCHDLSTYFMYKRLKYIWNDDTGYFELLKSWEETTFENIVHARPLTPDKVVKNRALYGSNEIDISLTSIMVLLINECLHPFYCFQILSCILWYADEYWMYATCIVVISMFSLSWQIYELRRNERALKNTVCLTTLVNVCRDEEGDKVFTEIDSTELVPGDLIEIPRNGCLMLCDAILLSGNCIVNESTLTGESVPITKHPLSEIPSRDALFDMHSFSRNVLFGGTTVIQTRNYSDKRVLALVVRTGFRTAKGELVRSILFPKPMKFKFTQDAFAFVAVLAILAVIGFAVSVYLMLQTGVETRSVVFRAFDLITIVVPPALPVAMTVGIVFAQRRLKSHDVFCINPNVINVCGVINVTCFDKTGTLTEDGLDLWGVVSTVNGAFREPEGDSCNLDNGPLVECMATCHSLTRIDNVLSGDPLDLKMFQFTKWEFIEEGLEDHCKFEMAVPAIVRPTPRNCSTSNVTLNTDLETSLMPYEVGILRHFPFSSSLQRMSVIARVLGSSHFNLYTKGAPETIQSLCRLDTIPNDFHTVLLEYTRQGFRVLALAWKPLKLSYTKLLRISRERVEHDLRFLGLLVMENRLKPETAPVIRTLRQANIRPVMVTGDNMLTSLSVARDCEMIDASDRVVLVSAKRPSNVEMWRKSSVTDSVLYRHSRDPVDNVLLTNSNVGDRMSFQNMTDEHGEDLVQFHYAEDLHKPVTEVIATKQNTFYNTQGVERNRSRLLSKIYNRTRQFTHHLRNTGSSSSSTAQINQSNQWSVDTMHTTSASYGSANGDLDYEYATNRRHNMTGQQKSTCPVSIQMLDRPDFHLAMSGKTWAIIREHYPWLIPKLVVKGTVFARFSPEQKTQLVEALQSVGYFVSMCGDGANDCGALKSAHAGISLSEAEASVASPFTYKQQHIGCVPDLIREGRCALVTSFGTFKFMVTYSLIQFFSIILLYIIGSNISDAQFLYIDLFLITTLGLTFGYSHAYPRLSVEPPGMRLVSMVTLLSLAQQLLTCGLIQMFTFISVRHQPWYLPLYDIDDEYELYNLESTCIFIVSVYQYIIMAVVFSKGAPYRKSIFSNYLFMINIVVCVSCSIFVTLGSVPAVQNLFSIQSIPFRFVLLLHGVSLFNFLLGYLLESIVDGVAFRKRIQHIRRALFPRHVSRKDYELIREEIDRLVGVWPPLIRSASVHALPRELFNELDACNQNSQMARRRISSTSTDSDQEDESNSRHYHTVQTDQPIHPPDSSLMNFVTVNQHTGPMKPMKRAHSAHPHRRHTIDLGDFNKSKFMLNHANKPTTDFAQTGTKQFTNDDDDLDNGTVGITRTVHLYFVDSNQETSIELPLVVAGGGGLPTIGKRKRSQSGGARHTYVPVIDPDFTTRC